ncbi:hypothetical protein T03_7913 [Trichinella britovi]|uniref:Uncharacterized protein n=2 Tax=Trichinella TaxID=6333 RepID=A0A0V1CVM4_TRIBR|nr:hypothetical protein T05_5883 [Trichinella murrelli]KRY53231.1 hypothetical protein T03_7913 [Trichinella britovi]KRZ87871.1 hypothetical protein T08_8163 [Trichinella sp. T8]
MHACLLNSVEFSSSHITTSHLQVTESVTHILMVQCFELLSITFRESNAIWHCRVECQHCLHWTFKL